LTVGTFFIDDLLPIGWDRDVFRWANRVAKPFSRKGPVASAPDSAGLDYSVIEYPAVQESLPWLATLHRLPELRERVSGALGEDVEASRHPTCAVNVNLISGAGGSYEMHRDTMPITGILFVNSCDGGDFIYGERDPELCSRLSPCRGAFVVGRFSEIWHGVAPLRGGYRISIPMGFRAANDDFDYRPEGFLPSA
jgi:hypothetical protein